ncbi:MAG: glycosyltransferase family 4 protein [Acidimicrobiia bacterium]|nr:glycosyltransferase family 4 protein [Acidimicrobiia bacterium]MDH3398952.1 glycosyltransferase family 4 protein [Acidimicrobiia bacterium]MDH5615064.1 glycosyltransferase family 4 protein [Acidimicrobiia bacterium]
MRIAVVCPYSIEEPGGVQQQAVGLVDGIRAAGHEAWLVAPGKTGPPDARLLGRAVRVRVNGSIAPIALHPGTIGRSRRAVRDADVVHVHEPLVALTSPAVFLGDGPPAVGTFHADPSTLVRRLYRVAAPVLRRVLSRLGAVTAVSQAAASAISDLVGEVVLIPNGIDAGAFSMAVTRHPARVAFLGRDEPRKGLDVLLTAWPLVRAAVADAELVVLGADRGASYPGIRFFGPIIGQEKRRQLAEAAVFCAPNLGGESFGISLVEAMAAGCAPVVSDLAAFRRVSSDVARYAAVADSRSLADRLIEALSDRTGTQVRGRMAVRVAAAFDWHHVLPRYLALYEQVAR